MSQGQIIYLPRRRERDWTKMEEAFRRNWPDGGFSQEKIDELCRRLKVQYLGLGEFAEYRHTLKGPSGLTEKQEEFFRDQAAALVKEIQGRFDGLFIDALTRIVKLEIALYDATHKDEPPGKLKTEQAPAPEGENVVLFPGPEKDK